MPVNFQPIQLSLGGTDQKSHRLLRAPGTLDRAINVTFSKLGDRVVAGKRRGYQRVRITATETVGATATSDVVWTHCATTPNNELVVFGHRWVFGVASPEEALRNDDSIVFRGPAPRGNARATFVSQAKLSQEVEDDT